MITKVVLKNWKSHSHSELEFGRGTNVLIGVMGSGKTSVTDAICFALFGTFPSLNAKRVSLAELIMNVPNEREKAEVELFFDYDGDGYRVERQVNRKGVNSAKLFREGRMLAGPGMRDVTEKVEEILDMNYELFSRAVYAEQNQIDYFLRLTPMQRKEKFDQLLGLDRYEKVRGNAVNLANRLKRNVEERNRFIREQRERLGREDIGRGRKEIEIKVKEVERLENLGAEVRSKKNTLEKEISEGEKKEGTHRALKERLTGVSAKISSLEDLIKESERRLQGRGLDEIKRGESKVEEGLSGLVKRAGEIDSEIERVGGEISGFEKSIGINKSKVLEIRKVVSQLKGAEASCPVCKSPLDRDTKHSILESDEKEIGKLELEAGKAMKEIGKANIVIEKLRKERSEIEEERELLMKKRAGFSADIDSAQKLEKRIIEVEGLKGEKKKLDARLKELSFDEAILRKNRDSFAENRERASGLEREIGYLKETIAEMEKRIKKHDDDLKQVEKEEAGIAGVDLISEKMALFTNSLKAAQAELRATLTDNVNEAMDDVWGRIYPYRDYTSAKISVVEGNFEVMARDRDGKWIRVDGILSGGERSAAALAMRIAISLVLTRNLSWLILDEPTHNLDVGAVNSLSELMKSHLPALVEQIFIITHDKEMEKAASSSLYVLERNKDEGEATKIAVDPAA